MFFSLTKLHCQFLILSIDVCVVCVLCMCVKVVSRVQAILVLPALDVSRMAMVSIMNVHVFQATVASSVK